MKNIMKKILVCSLALVSFPVVADDASPPAPKPTIESLQKQVDDLTVRNRALELKGEEYANEYIKEHDARLATQAIQQAKSEAEHPKKDAPK